MEYGPKKLTMHPQIYLVLSLKGRNKENILIFSKFCTFFETLMQCVPLAPRYKKACSKYLKTHWKCT